MFRQQTQSDNRGQVGIQTLIIFIALIAVAAITAGILLETANVLQEDADRTGDEASEQVTDRLDVVEVFADTDGSDYTEDENGEEFVEDADYYDADGAVDHIRLQVSLPAGADAVDLTQTQVSLATDNQDVLLTHDGVNAVNEDTADEFVEPFKDFSVKGLAGYEDVNDVEVISDQDQIVEIQIELHDLIENEELEEEDEENYAGEDTFLGTHTDFDVNAGNEIDVTLRTGAGAETHKSLMVPDPITGEVISLA